MIAAILLLAAGPTAGTCDLANIRAARSLHEVLGRRAAKIMSLAATAGPDADALLNTLIDPSASFDLGVGDVGRPLGTGVAGARLLSKTMNAEEFRFLGWDYMDSDVDACSKQSITVEFINGTDRRISQVKFSFREARLVAAKGWERSFEGGPLPRPTPPQNGS